MGGKPDLMSGEDAIYYQTIQTVDGQTVRVNLTTESNTTKKCIPVSTKPIIPVVFIPGMMTTYLRDRRTKKVAWSPPSGILPSIGALLSHLVKGAKERQQRLDAQAVEVLYKGPLRSFESIDKTLARKRGWGAIWKDGDQGFLDKLQLALRVYQKDGDGNQKLLHDWDYLKGLKPEYYGGIYGDAKEAVTQADIDVLAKYQFDVWACGYNWLAHCVDGAQIDVYDRLMDVIFKEYDGLCDRKPNKILIITHSMGGLVGRTLTQLIQRDRKSDLERNSEDYLSSQDIRSDNKLAQSNKLCDTIVWGVSHGCQPSTGAPAAYHHARCGYDGIANPIFGRNAREVLPLMANAPGSMSLLPFQGYQSGESWLFLGYKSSEITREFVAFPSQKGNVYDEVYKSKMWYGLLPEGNEYIVDPTNQSPKPYDVITNPVSSATDALLVSDEPLIQTHGGEIKKREYVKDHSQFCEEINKTKEFHEAFFNAGYHPRTFAHSESQQTNRKVNEILSKIYDPRAKGDKIGVWNYVYWVISPGISESKQKTSFPELLSNSKECTDNFEGNLCFKDCGSSAFFAPFNVPAYWFEPYSINNSWYDSDGKVMDKPKQPELLNNSSKMARSGDGTVGAASGEAPYMWGKDGKLMGYFFHGAFPAHKDLDQLVNNAKEIAMSFHSQKQDERKASSEEKLSVVEALEDGAKLVETSLKKGVELIGATLETGAELVGATLETGVELIATPFGLDDEVRAVAETIKDKVESATENLFPKKESTNDNKNEIGSPFYDSSYDHAFSYADKDNLTYYATLHAIAKIVSKEVKPDHFGEGVSI